MPPRHAYWTILIDDQPTAFRAHDPEELLPTLNRLREKNASAVMKWFERGQLFDSRDAAREAGLGKGERRWEGPRPQRDEADRGRPPAPAGGSDNRERRWNRPAPDRDRPRDKTWRPGGEHRDPRQKYKDAKKDKWNRFKDKVRERHEQRGPRDPEAFTPPHGDKFRRPDERDSGRERPREQRWEGGRQEDRNGAPSRPHGDRLREQRPRGDWRARNSDTRRDEWRNESRDRPAEPRRDERRDRPPRREDDRRDWKPKPPGGFRKKPFGSKPAAGPRSGKKPFAPKSFDAKGSGPPRGGANFRKRSPNRPPRRRRDDE